MNSQRFGWVLGFASLIAIAGVYIITVQAATRIPVPQVGVPYTVGQILALINTNNPHRTSQVLVLTTAGTSQGVNLLPYANRQVVLYQAADRIQQLLAQKLGVPIGTVRLINGHHGPTKLFSVL